MSHPPEFLRLPVQPAKRNYYEGGLTKGFCPRSPLKCESQFGTQVHRWHRSAVVLLQGFGIINGVL
jgi:hypothetical protein